jgi:hypothetical protein
MKKTAGIQFKLRLPADLRADLEKAAADGDRSLSAEIVGRLKDSFDVRNYLSTDILGFAYGVTGGVLQGILAGAPENVAEWLRNTIDDVERNMRDRIARLAAEEVVVDVLQENGLPIPDEYKLKSIGPSRATHPPLSEHDEPLPRSKRKKPRSRKR